VPSILPRSQKCAPDSPPFEHRVSAALLSRDAGDRRVSLGDPGLILGDCAPLDVGELLPDCYSYQKPLRVKFMSRR